MRTHETLTDEYGNQDKDEFRVGENAAGHRVVTHNDVVVAVFLPGWEDMAGILADELNRGG